jgi:hypothetical protein
MTSTPRSIFAEYYQPSPIVDRYAAEPDRGVDVMIPVFHTNELWHANLLSIYREIPVHTLILGNAGGSEEALATARAFPRVRVLDHRSFTSLGYSLRKMIEDVETEWFVYLHSDVYLPAGWFDVMERRRGEFDWFGSAMQHTVMIEYPNNYGERPWAGSQMGRKAVFEAGLGTIDDDYVYRQEDFVLSGIVRRGGGREGKVPETFHYHQTIHKPSASGRRIKTVKLDLEMSRDEEVRTWMTQAKGVVKYLQPDGEWVIHEAAQSVHRLIELGAVTRQEFEAWTRQTNPAWIPFIRRGLRRKRFAAWFNRAGQLVRRVVRGGGTTA